MNVFFYVIEHDLGFAPNPFHGVCSMGCCKPDIRKVAAVGDYVLGTGAVKPKLRGHLTYWMKVDEVVTFDQYWKDPRFRRKKPVMHGTTYLRYGDNIYHRDGGDTYQQEELLPQQRRRQRFARRPEARYRQDRQGSSRPDIRLLGPLRHSDPAEHRTFSENRSRSPLQIYRAAKERDCRLDRRHARARLR